MSEGVELEPSQPSPFQVAREPPTDLLPGEGTEQLLPCLMENFPCLAIQGNNPGSFALGHLYMDHSPLQVYIPGPQPECLSPPQTGVNQKVKEQLEPVDGCA